MSLLQVEPNRTCLERLSIPKRLRCRNKCCKCNLSWYFCLMIITIIDIFLLLKYIAMIIEMLVYKQNYPVLIMSTVLVKFVIQASIVGIQSNVVFKNKMFSYSKSTYGLKFVEILVVLFQAFCYRARLSYQCNRWLSTPAHGFHRDSSDIHRARPMTQVFYCNFNRILEDKNRMDDANTIHYYTPNRVLPDIMIILEIVYCIICMMLYLILIYWSAKNEPEVITAQDSL